MKILNLVGKLLYGVIVIFIIGLLLLFIAPTVFGYKPYTVVSGSMEPTYHVGSMIYVKEVAFEELQDGDVITFKSGNIAVTHRIIQVDTKNNGVITQGDANNASDGLINSSQIIGRATSISIPYLGYLSIMLGSTRGKVLILVVLAGLALCSYILRTISNDDTKG